MTKTFVFRRPDFLDMKTRFSDLLVRTLAYIMHYTHTHTQRFTTRPPLYNPVTTN